MNSRQYQIHIGGSKRSGKTTLARLLKEQLLAQGIRVVILDIDEVRVGIFGDESTIPVGSPVNQHRHMCAYHALSTLLIPKVLEAGGSPITVATHSRRQAYHEAKVVASHFCVPLRYILLHAPPFEEVVRRARSDSSSFSDTCNLDVAGSVRDEYFKSLERFEESYCDFEEHHVRIPQGLPEDMAREALQFVFS